MARGRKAIPVDKILFQKIVTDLENRFGFANRSKLWSAVASTGWAKSIGLSPQVAMLKAQVLNLTLKTPVGQRGRRKGDDFPAVANRQRKRRGIPPEQVTVLKKIYDSSLCSKIDRAARGSMKAAIALKCIDCCGGQKKEVALCEVTDCVLWNFRPYKHLPESGDSNANTNVSTTSV
jgi:hypothetical protein